MIIYFVRHGQTDWNKALRWQGSSDNELNQLGREQARQVSAYFVEHHIQPSVVLSSPLKRARATAECIAAAFDMQISVEAKFKEIDLGEFEGKTTQALKREYGQLFDDWLAQHHRVASPGGENIDQAVNRVQGILGAHIDQFGDKTVIVAHQAILMAMKAALSETRDIERLASYKQANFEIDVWDVERAVLSSRIDIRQ